MNPTATTTTTETPNIVFRVSIHNQIYNSKYYVVTGWKKAPSGGWKPTGSRYGMRGNHGDGSLGLSKGTAIEIASDWNAKKGWTKGMEVLNSNGNEAFQLHV